MDSAPQTTNCASSPKDFPASVKATFRYGLAFWFYMAPCRFCGSRGYDLTHQNCYLSLMSATSERLCLAFQGEAPIRYQSHPPLESSRPTLADVQSSILIPLEAFACIHLNDSNAAMREVVMRMRGDYCLVVESPAEKAPLGYLHKRRLLVELLTGNRSDIRRLVAIAPNISASFDTEQALQMLASKNASAGLLCDSAGAAIGLFTRESLLCTRKSMC